MVTAATLADIEAVRSYTGPCWLCGVMCTQVPGAGDEWAWAGPDGKVTGRDRDLIRNCLGPDGKPANPYEALAWLREHGPATEYVMLKVRLDLGLSFHVHQVMDKCRPAQPAVRYHCEYPAWLRPSGWQCRVCGSRLDEQEAGSHG